MKITELLEGSSEEDVLIKMAAALTQIASRVKDTGTNSKMSLTALINILNGIGVHITDKEFRDVVAAPPLNSIIAGVEGDKVTFIGQRGETSDSVKPDQSTATLEKMAKRAASKRD